MTLILAKTADFPSTNARGINSRTIVLFFLKCYLILVCIRTTLLVGFAKTKS